MTPRLGRFPHSARGHVLVGLKRRTPEWTSDGFFASQKGKLLVVRYSGGDDIVALTVDASGNVPAGGQSPVAGATAFGDPLDLAADPVTGRIYVTEHGGRKVTLLRPQ